MDLQSIAPATRTVALHGAAVEVTGISLRKLTQLVGAYPELIGFLGAGGVDVASLLVKGPEMALAIFALGLVGPARKRFWQRRALRISNDDLLAAFDDAAAGEQIDALADIVDLTLRGQRGRPFLQSLAAATRPQDLAETQEETRSTPTPASSSG